MKNFFDYCLSPRGSTTLANEREKNGSPEPFEIPYWGIGNENWGGGGNMEPEIYAHEYRKYAAIAGSVPGERKLIGCGPSDWDFNWTRKFMEVFERSEKRMQGFSMHYYIWSNDDPVGFTKDGWYRMMRKAADMELLIKRHWSVIEGFGMEKHASLVVDEWGCWHPGGSGPSKGYNLFEQQSTMRDALVAAVTLNIFNNNCEKIMMANVAQLVNNLHCLFFAGGENFAVTPTCHVFDMFKEHQGATAVKTIAQADSIDCVFGEHDVRKVENPSVSASYKGNDVLITVANLSADDDLEFMLEPFGASIENSGKVTVLTHDDYHAHNTFEFPHTVTPKTGLTDLVKPVRIPKASVVSIEARIRRV